MRFAFLSTINEPLLPHFIYYSYKNNVNKFIIICDSKNYSEKDKKIWLERTGGKLENLKSSNLYGVLKNNPIYLVENHNSIDTQRLIEKLNISCLLNAGTPRKISKKLIDFVAKGILNIHPGILPKYRGCSAVEWSLYNNDPVGNTAHFMDSDYDTGPIIQTEKYKIMPNQSYQDIRNMIYLNGCKLASRIMLQIQNNKIDKSLIKFQKRNDGKYWPPISQNKFDIMIKKNF